MRTIDFMEMLKQYMDKNRFQRQLYPTLMIGEQTSIVKKKLMNDCDNITMALTNNDIVGIAEHIGESIFTLFGLCQTMGLPIEGIVDEIYRSKVHKKRLNIASVLQPHIQAKMRIENDRTDKVSKE